MVPKKEIEVVLSLDKGRDAHQAEIAQSQGFLLRAFASSWVHGNHMTQ